MESDTDSNQPGADDSGQGWRDDPANDAAGGADALGAWGVRDYRDPDAYWRRRFFMLAAGFAALCGMAWGISSLLGPARSDHAGVLGKAGTALPSRAKNLSVPPGKGAGQPVPSPGARPACRPASMVLSLFTSQARYSEGQRPQFEVYAVSMAPAPCDLAYRHSDVRVIVSREGHVVWDSARCGPQGASSVPSRLRFTRGVPRVVTVSWNGRAGTAGCTGPTRAEAAGTFSVVATADGGFSPVRTFTLAR